ncbi:MAG: RsmE family RNA methyltransferase [Candidatus Dadabacteria bacterium]|nr:RsmE family RNA methyltransferase [Candidatus Dadabacteria bacterium]NIQ14561.1 RsmE family RNA methyltransferase [Candidatus Dadabacteria bacterium]
MPRFPIKIDDISEGFTKISGDDYKHITKVLRLKVGNNITLFDESSFEHEAKIINITTRDLTLEIQDSKKVKRESDLTLNLFQCIPKSSKFELIIQKATELGVTNIIPVISERTQNIKNFKRDRLNRIAIESSKQCNRTKPLKIYEIVNYYDSFPTYYKSDINIILHIKSNESFKSYLNKYPGKISSVNIYIGPEGGFTNNEIEVAKKNNYTDLGLGNRILRTETAAISAITLLQFYFGDL